jgi:hypothetical protein
MEPVARHTRVAFSRHTMNILDSVYHTTLHSEKPLLFVWARLPCLSTPFQAAVLWVSFGNVVSFAKSMQDEDFLQMKLAGIPEIDCSSMKAT